MLKQLQPLWKEGRQIYQSLSPGELQSFRQEICKELKHRSLDALNITLRYNYCSYMGIKKVKGKRGAAQMIKDLKHSIKTVKQKEKKRTRQMKMKTDKNER